MAGRERRQAARLIAIPFAAPLQLMAVAHTARSWPHAVQELWQLIGGRPDREFLVRVSYMEVGKPCSAVSVPVGHPTPAPLAVTLLTHPPSSRPCLQAAATSLHAQRQVGRSLLPFPRPALPCPCLPAAQIYNEAVNDLLHPKGDSLRVRDVVDERTRKVVGVQVAGLHEMIVSDAEEVRGCSGWARLRCRLLGAHLRAEARPLHGACRGPWPGQALPWVGNQHRPGHYAPPCARPSPWQALTQLAAGEQQRAVGSTGMNERSSRSHAIFRLVVESRDKDSSQVGASHGSAGGWEHAQRLADHADSCAPISSSHGMQPHHTSPACNKPDRRTARCWSAC